jgi:hypothetical protein
MENIEKNTYDLLNPPVEPQSVHPYTKSSKEDVSLRREVTSVYTNAFLGASARGEGEQQAHNAGILAATLSHGLKATELFFPPKK